MDKTILKGIQGLMKAFRKSETREETKHSMEEADSSPDTRDTTISLKDQKSASDLTPLTPMFDFEGHDEMTLRGCTESILELESTQEGTGSMIAYKVPPSLTTPATHIPGAERRSTHLFNFQGYQNQDCINQSLWEAAEKNRLEKCRELLIKQGAQVNSRGLNEYTALHFAANEGHCEVCELLLAWGAKVNSTNYMERTPLHLACVRGHFQIVEALLNHGADINAIDIDNNTPMHYAAEHGYIEIVNKLLEKDPNLEIQNRLGRTPSELAVNRDVASLLRQYKNYKYRQPTKSPTPEAHNRVEISSSINPLDFEGLCELGRGSFGEVFLVRKRDTGQLYAMKVLRKDKIMSNLYTGCNLIKYAMTERNVLSYIKHPFIVGLNFAFQTPEKLCLILDYCPGGDLGYHLSKEKKFSEERTRVYLAEIILALEALHKHDIIFRDLKPENVVLDTEGHALLTDFGLSKEGIYDNNLAKSFCGSVAYLAPEMLRRQGHGKAVDWYLLGVLMYEMLLGIPPYFSNNREQLFHNIQYGKLRLPSLMSSEAKSLLIELLQRDPSRRLGARGDAQELKNHRFFSGVRWDTVIKRELRPASVCKSSGTHNMISPERMYGDLNLPVESTKRFNGWTFVSN